MHNDPADENRLFMTLERFGHRFEGKSNDEKADEFTRLLNRIRHS
jgi:hypothetical protein